MIVNSLRTVWRWICNKFGRIATMIGGTLMTLEVVDLNPAKPYLADMFNERVATHIIAGVGAFFFALSYVRHQIVANKNSKEPP